MTGILTELQESVVGVGELRSGLPAVGWASGTASGF